MNFTFSLKHQTEEMSAKILSDFPPVYAVAITGSSEEVRKYLDFKFFRPKNMYVSYYPTSANLEIF